MLCIKKGEVRLVLLSVLISKACLSDCMKVPMELTTYIWKSTINASFTEIVIVCRQHQRHKNV